MRTTGAGQIGACLAEAAVFSGLAVFLTVVPLQTILKLWQ